MLEITVRQRKRHRLLRQIPSTLRSFKHRKHQRVLLILPFWAGRLSNRRLLWQELRTSVVVRRLDGSRASHHSVKLTRRFPLLLKLLQPPGNAVEGWLCPIRVP